MKARGWLKYEIKQDKTFLYTGSLFSQNITEKLSHV